MGGCVSSSSSVSSQIERRDAGSLLGTMPRSTRIGGAQLRRVVDKNLLSSFEPCLTTNPDWLGKDRDATSATECTGLNFVMAWQVQHDVEESRYKLAKTELDQQASELPGGLHEHNLKSAQWARSLDCCLDAKLNECMALHGTSPDVLGQILSSGLNERYSSGAFGSGTYLAEDAGKADQYCKVDQGYSESYSTLHKALYPEGVEHPGDICYLLVCKVLMGESAITFDGHTKEGGGDLWANVATRRELGPVPNSDPPFAHHSLLVKTGKAVKRYREIVVFHSDKILTKYVVAYRRGFKETTLASGMKVETKVEAKEKGTTLAGGMKVQRKAHCETKVEAKEEDVIASFAIDQASVRNAVDKSLYAQRSLAPLQKELQSGDTKLFKGSWALSWAKSGKSLPRRQDMPAEAFWTPEELLPKLQDGPKGFCNIDDRKVRITSLSCCWLCPTNPDPEGKQLRTIAAAIDLRLNHMPDFEDAPVPGQKGRDTRFPGNNCWHPRFPNGKQFVDGTARSCVLEDVAMFFGWCSLYQEKRTLEEAAAFKRTLKSVKFWYAHAECQVWRLSMLPADGTGVAKYSDHVWPYFESCVAGLLHDHDNLIDLDVLVETSNQCCSWKSLVEASPTLKPPVAPGQFVKNLAEKKISSEADHDFVAQKYAQTFAEVLGSAYELDFYSQCWGPDEFAALADVLSWTPQLNTLSVADNSMGVMGAKVLAMALPQCPKLERIFIDANEIGDAGIAAFIEVMPLLAPNDQLYCSNCGLSKEGGAKLRAAYDKAGHTGLLQGDHCAARSCASSSSSSSSNESWATECSDESDSEKTVKNPMATNSDTDSWEGC